MKGMKNNFAKMSRRRIPTFVRKIYMETVKASEHDRHEKYFCKNVKLMDSQLSKKKLFQKILKNP